MSDVTVTIGTIHYQTRITARGHELAGDEPEAMGGSDAGPDPYELLLGSLGSCTAITVRMYADRKGWPLSEVAVHLSQERVHAEDCEHCESETGDVLRITKRLELTGDLDDAQRERLHQIADRCPVHQSLLHEIVIESS